MTLREAHVSESITESSMEANEPRSDGATHVLVVDDDPTNRRLLEALLTRAGHTVEVAAGGAEALRLASEEPPDLVLLDYMMPEMDGPEVIERLYAAGVRVPVVMITASAAPEHISAAFDAGAQDYLTRPVNPRLLEARVQSALKVHATQRQAVLEGERSAVLEASLREAREVQRALLPAATREFPGWCAAGGCVPADGVGGDVFDYEEVGSGRWVAVLVDVSGHGMGAALIASMVRAELRAQLLHRQLAGALQLVNDELVRKGAGHHACVGAVEFDGHGNALVVNAGLPPIVQLRGDAIIAEVRASGVPPGLLERQRYETTSLVLAPGDRLLLMSDGLTEAVGHADEIEQVLARLGLAALSLNAITATIESSVGDVARGRDDATLVVLERQG